MSHRTRRILIGAGLGVLPGVVVIAAAVVIALWVESGGGSFGVVGVPLAIVGGVVGGLLGAAKPETLRNPRVGAILGAIPGLLAAYFLAEFGVPVALAGAWVGYLLALRAQRPPPGQEPPIEEESDREGRDRPADLTGPP